MTHKDLNVWKSGIELGYLVYKYTDLIPKSEEFGLKSQLKRAAVSVPTNIVGVQSGTIVRNLYNFHT